MDETRFGHAECEVPGNSQQEIPSQLLGLWVWSGGRRLRLRVSAVGRQALGELSLGAQAAFPSGAVSVSVLVPQHPGLKGTTGSVGNSKSGVRQ